VSEPEKPHYLVEFHQIGKAMKVTALDPVTLTEVSIVGDVNASQQQLTTLAVRKLEYMLQKKRLT
jgi:hypothetical protein